MEGQQQPQATGSPAQHQQQTHPQSGLPYAPVQIPPTQQPHQTAVGNTSAPPASQNLTLPSFATMPPQYMHPYQQQMFMPPQPLQENQQQQQQQQQQVPPDVAGAQNPAPPSQYPTLPSQGQEQAQHQAQPQPHQQPQQQYHPPHQQQQQQHQPHSNGDAGSQAALPQFAAGLPGLASAPPQTSTAAAGAAGGDVVMSAQQYVQLLQQLQMAQQQQQQQQMFLDPAMQQALLAGGMPPMMGAGLAMPGAAGIIQQQQLPIAAASGNTEGGRGRSRSRSRGRRGRVERGKRSRSRSHGRDNRSRSRSRGRRGDQKPDKTIHPCFAGGGRCQTGGDAHCPFALFPRDYCLDHLRTPEGWITGLATKNGFKNHREFKGPDLTLCKKGNRCSRIHPASRFYELGKFHQRLRDLDYGVCYRCGDVDKMKEFNESVSKHSGAPRLCCKREKVCADRVQQFLNAQMGPAGGADAPQKQQKQQRNSDGADTGAAAGDRERVIAQLKATGLRTHPCVRTYDNCTHQPSCRFEVFPQVTCIRSILNNGGGGCKFGNKCKSFHLSRDEVNGLFDGEMLPQGTVRDLLAFQKQDDEVRGSNPVPLCRENQSHRRN